jgi:hypothetical protein
MPKPVPPLFYNLVTSASSQTVLSVLSADCDDLRQSEYEDRDLFDGGRSILSRFSGRGRSESHRAIEEVLSESEGSRDCFLDGSLTEGEDSAFRLAGDIWVWDDLEGF